MRGRASSLLLLLLVFSVRSESTKDEFDGLPEALETTPPPTATMLTQEGEGEGEGESPFEQKRPAEVNEGVDEFKTSTAILSPIVTSTFTSLPAPSEASPAEEASDPFATEEPRKTTEEDSRVEAVAATTARNMEEKRTEEEDLETPSPMFPIVSLSSTNEPETTEDSDVTTEGLFVGDTSLFNQEGTLKTLTEEFSSTHAAETSTRKGEEAGEETTPEFPRITLPEEATTSTVEEATQTEEIQVEKTTEAAIAEMTTEEVASSATTELLQVQTEKEASPETTMAARESEEEKGDTATPATPATPVSSDIETSETEPAFTEATPGETTEVEAEEGTMETLVDRVEEHGEKAVEHSHEEEKEEEHTEVQESTTLETPFRAHVGEEDMAPETTPEPEPQPEPTHEHEEEKEEEEEPSPEAEPTSEKEMPVTETEVPRVAFKTPFGVRLTNIDFSAEFEDSTSGKYKKLREQIVPELREVFEKVFPNNFVGVEITGFKKGSVVVDGVLYTQNRIEDLEQAATSFETEVSGRGATLGGNDVDTHSIHLGGVTSRNIMEHVPEGASRGGSSSFVIGGAIAIAVAAILVVAFVVIATRLRNRGGKPVLSSFINNRRTNGSLKLKDDDLASAENGRAAYSNPQTPVNLMSYGSSQQAQTAGPPIPMVMMGSQMMPQGQA